MYIVGELTEEYVMSTKSPRHIVRGASCKLLKFLFVEWELQTTTPGVGVSNSFCCGLWH
jgi:hypothetical protein